MSHCFQRENGGLNELGEVNSLAVLGRTGKKKEGKKKKEKGVIFSLLRYFTRRSPFLHRPRRLQRSIPAPECFCRGGGGIIPGFCKP